MDTPEFQLKDSGDRREHTTGSQRDRSTGKGRYDLIPDFFWGRLAALMEAGAVKYGDRNWERGQPLSWYKDSGLRHALKAFRREEDEDHVFQAIWNLMAYEWTKAEIIAGRLPASLWDTPGNPFLDTPVKQGPQPPEPSLPPGVTPVDTPSDWRVTQRSCSICGLHGYYPRTTPEGGAICLSCSRIRPSRVSER